MVVAALCDVAGCATYSHFGCKTGGCIRRELMCNGVADCKDGSDETEACGEYPLTYIIYIEEAKEYLLETLPWTW